MATEFEDIILRFTAQDDEGKDAVREFFELLEALGMQTAEPEVQLEGIAQVRTDVAQVAAFLELLGKMEADPSIDVHGEVVALGKIGIVARALDNLNKNKNVDIDIHTSSSVGRLGSVFNKLRDGFGVAQEAASGFGESLGKVGVSIGGFAFRLGPALIPLLLAVGSYILLIVGGLAALASSAILAAGALAGIAISLAALAGPALLLAVAGAASLTKVLKTLQAEEQARLQKTQQVIAGDQQRAASLRAEEDAARSLQDAQKNLADAFVRAHQEMEDAATRAKNAVLDLREAQLGVTDRKLGLRRALLALKEFREETGTAGSGLESLFRKFTDVDLRQDPSKILSAIAQQGHDLDEDQRLRLLELIQDVKHAKLDEKRANLDLKTSETDLGRAQEVNNEFRKKGIVASDQYVAALERVEEAQRMVARAAADKKMLAAQAKSLAMAGELNENERTLLGLLKKIKVAWQDVSSVWLEPIMDVAFKGLESVPGLLKAISPGMKAISGAIAGILEATGEALIDPKNVKLFNQLAKTGAKLAGPVGRGIKTLFTIFLELANAFMPVLVDLITRFADKLGSWGEWLSDGENMNKVVETTVKHLEVWLDIVEQLGRIFIGFLVGAESPGLKLADALRDSLTNLANLLSTTEGRKALSDWLDHAVSATADVADNIGTILKLLAKLGPVIDVLLTPFNAFFDFVETGLDLLNEGLDLARDNIRRVVEALTFDKPNFDEIFSAVTEFGEDLFDAMYNIGRYVLIGLVKGMQDILKDVKGDLEDIWQSIVNSALGGFKIGSPSKVFQKIGGDVMAGLRKGIEGAKTTITTAVEGSMVVPAMQGANLAGGRLATGSRQTTNDYGTYIEKVEMPLNLPSGGIDPEAGTQRIMKNLRRRGRPAI